MTGQEERLRTMLRGAAAPDEGAAGDRAWRVIGAAYRGRRDETPSMSRVFGPSARRGAGLGRLRRRGLQLALVVGLMAVLISPAGATVRRWVGDAVDPGREPAMPALTALPAPGRLLVDSPRGPWVIRADGSKRLLGDYGQSTWSPHGLFVAAADGRELLAVEPDGDVHWSLARPSPIRAPSWSPDGYRIAYLSGAALRVVSADGTGDHLLARAAAGVVPTWHRGAGHVLAFATPGGGIRIVNADSGRTLVRASLRRPPLQLHFTPAGRLLVVERRELVLLDRGGGPVWRLPAPPGTGFRAAAVRPAGGGFAAIAADRSRARSELLAIDGDGAARRLFAGPGRFADVAYAPDSKWLLLGWQSADQWLFLRPGHPRQLLAVADISAQLDPGTTSRPAFPHVAGWCCGG